MDAQLKAKWVEALRSGEYRQGKGYLESDGRHCCLGVLCSLQDERWKEKFFRNKSLYTETLPSKLKAGLSQDEREKLASMNDDGHPFSEIADYIEKNL